ncbi:MAG: FAD-binding domain-containing protein [Candidatus Marinamargulisbacteria bacterium]
MAINIIWFKRDLRINDHPVLSEACSNGNALPIYIFEPDLWAQPDMSYRHFQFLCDSLIDLNHQLATIGYSLTIFTDDVISVFQHLHNTHGISQLWSTQETWNGWTYNRDKQVRAWTNDHHIPWIERPQHGVIRGLKNRDGWSKKWHETMSAPLLSPPKSRPATPSTKPLLPTAEMLGLTPDTNTTIQPGGTSHAHDYLASFLNHRGEHYTKAMSSPVTAFDACSRLSPHLAFGTISLRTVFQATEEKRTTIRTWPRNRRGAWGRAIRSFSGRLRWHCHFIQKLEDDPSMEYYSLHSAHRIDDNQSFNKDLFHCWSNGNTGFPLVDACMRALHHTGWINFRMRAMLMSVATHHLQLPWRDCAIYLATQFTDYEPGIHYSQCQMQAGITGINAIRIYNPIKQSIDQDPSGVFIRTWVPELASIPDSGIHHPWHYGATPPVVDEAIARKNASKKLYARRKSPHFKTEANAIFKKHGSRKKNHSKSSSNQLKLNFGDMP